jgi:hypothetical protein
MIKIMVHVSKAIVGLLIALLFSSCFNGETVDGSGNVIKQPRAIAGEFTSISVEKALEVYIIQGSPASVVVEADDNLQEHIKVELKGNELNITSDVNIDAGSKKIIVTMPKIESIDASSAATVKGKTVLKGDEIKLITDSAATMEVAVDTKSLSCEAGSSGTIKVSGRTEELESESNSAGSINAKGLIAQDAKSEAASGGSTVVNVIGKLTAEASSGGNITYSNNPETVDSNATSGGSISKE